MPLPTNTTSSSRPTSPRRWLWAPLLLALASPVALASPPTPAVDFEKEAARAESSGEVVRVAPDFQTNLTVRGAERVWVDDGEVAQASLGEPNQVMVLGTRAGRARLLVLRGGERPLLLRVEVVK